MLSPGPRPLPSPPLLSQWVWWTRLVGKPGAQNLGGKKWPRKVRKEPWALRTHRLEEVQTGQKLTQSSWSRTRVISTQHPDKSSCGLDLWFWCDFWTALSFPLAWCIGPSHLETTSSRPIFLLSKFKELCLGFFSPLLSHQLLQYQVYPGFP